MTGHEKDLVLAVLKHHLPQDLRHKVMREIPQAYNAWMGREHMQSVRKSDGKVYR